MSDMTMTQIKKDTVVRFTPDEARNRVTVLVSYVTIYKGLDFGFIMGHRCNEDGEVAPRTRIKSYKVSLDATIEVRT